MRSAVHDGLIANDVVGFHTERWRRNFVYCVREILGEDVTAKTVTAPISVDAAEFEELAQSDAVLEAEREIVADRPRSSSSASTGPTRRRTSCAVSRRSSSTSTGIRRCTDASTMLALLDPSRQDIAEYAEYLASIEREARRVNGRLATMGWTPIELEIEDDFPRSVAAFKQFDVLLVNAIFDGMNLVAKEAPLVNQRDGVVVLSENAGAHAELGEWVLSVNPFDVEAQADALEEAVEMPLGSAGRGSTRSGRRCSSTI